MRDIAMKKKTKNSKNLKHKKIFEGCLQLSKADSETISLGMFPTLLTLHKNDEHAIQILRAIKKLEFQKNSSNHISRDIQDLPEWVSLMSFFKDSLNEHCRMNGYKIEDHQITQAWANKSNKGDSHHLHYHVNSFLSGIYYVNNADGDSIFARPPTPSGFHPEMTGLQDFSNTVKISPLAGYLAIFPSHLTHGTAANKKGNARFSISFNSLPRGAFGSRVAKSFAQLG